MDNWLRKPNVVRMIALLVGIMLWVVVHMDQHIDTSSNQPVTVESTFNNILITPKFDQENYYIVSIEPKFVQFVASGKESIVNNLRLNTNYRIALDVSNYKPGEYDINLTKEGFPASLDIEIYPKTARVKLEKLVSRQFPVRIELTGNSAEGYLASNVQAKFSNVVVKSSLALLNEVRSVRGEVSIDKANADVKQKINLYAYNASGKLLDVRIEPNQVDVTVPIRKGNHLLPIIVSLLGEVAPGYAIESLVINPKEVDVNGSAEAIEQLQSYQAEKIDVSNLSESKQFSVGLQLAEGITRVNPTTIQVQVNVVPSSTSSINEVPFKLVGQDTSLISQIESSSAQSVDLILEGAPSLLNNIRKEDLQAILDVSKLGIGEHEIQISFKLPPFIKVKDKSRSKATVIIK